MEPPKELNFTIVPALTNIKTQDSLLKMKENLCMFSSIDY